MPEPTVVESPSNVSPSDVEAHSPPDVSPSAVSVAVEEEAEPNLPKQSLDIDTYQLEFSSSDVDKFPESVKGVDSNEVAPSLDENSENDVACSTDDADDVDSCSDEQPEMMVSGSCCESDFDDHAVPDGELSECSESDFDDHAVPGGDLSEEESECSDIWDDDYVDDTAISNDFMGALSFEMDSRMEEAKVMEMVKMRSMTGILMLLCGLIVLMCALLLLLDAVLIIEEIQASEVKLLKTPAPHNDQNANVIGSGAGISIFFVALIGAAFFARSRWVRQYSKGVL